jgi:hypothetical protein
VEYFGKTQIGNPAVVITSQGNALPTPEVLATVDANAEAWEGVLIQVTGSVTNADLGFGEWALSDGSGDLAVDDAGYDAIGAGLVAANNQLQVTGALDYSFGVFKVQLRDAMDAQLYGCAIEGAANYNDLASIDDGSCVYEGGECGLFFSEMAEGSSNNKYIELYNPTQSTIFLSEYTLGNCSNGCDVTGEFDYLTFNFPAGDVVEAGSTYIIAHPSADSLILAAASMTYQYLSNGDDAFALLDITGDSCCGGRVRFIGGRPRLWICGGWCGECHPEWHLGSQALHQPGQRRRLGDQRRHQRNRFGVDHQSL